MAEESDSTQSGLVAVASAPVLAQSHETDGGLSVDTHGVADGIAQGNEESAVSGATAHSSVPAHGQSPGALDVSGPMMLFTWIIFGLLAIILHKIAWKPILKGLEQREALIRKSLEDAEKARAELAAVEAKTKELIAGARAEGEAIVATARKSAEDLAAAVEKRAQEKAMATTDDAKREISAATEKARMVLRAESAELAIALAGRIVDENMDSDKNRDFVRKLVSRN